MCRAVAFTLYFAAAICARASVSDVGSEPASVPSDDPPRHAVVVELFTSQGCESCPPADRLLSALGEESAGRVVPLSFHVDFWNSLGWKDPFSSHAWTERQAAYARALRVQQVYTPQAVVDGASQMVGSDAERLRAAIAAAAARPAARVSVEVEPSGSRVLVRAGVERPDELRGRPFDLFVALFETGLVTAVGRGENGGRTLRNDYVVRDLDRAARLEAGGPGRSQHTVKFSLSKGWKESRLGVAAFLQDPQSLEIRGAGIRLLSGAVHDASPERGAAPPSGRP